MNAPVTLHFTGLCGVRFQNGNSALVYLPDGSSRTAHHEHDDPRPAALHECTLAVRLAEVDLDDMRWKPDAVLSDREGKQVGVWKIGAGTWLTSGADGHATQQAGKGPSPLKLHELHQNVSMRADDEMEAMGVSIARLKGGRAEFGSERDVMVVRPDGRRDQASIPKVFSWSADTDRTTLHSTRGWIHLLGGATAWITNIARVKHPKGLDHFGHYYALIRGVRVTDQVKLAPIEAPVKLDEPVFDCVPPVGLP